jgi:hypothetical protein
MFHFNGTMSPPMVLDRLGKVGCPNHQCHIVAIHQLVCSVCADHADRIVTASTGGGHGGRACAQYVRVQRHVQAFKIKCAQKGRRQRSICSDYEESACTRSSSAALASVRLAAFSAEPRQLHPIAPSTFSTHHLFFYEKILDCKEDTDAAIMLPAATHRAAFNLMG